MKLSNVAGFISHTANIIILVYSLIFFPETTASSVNSFIFVAVLAANVVGLLFAASAGIIVNHMVRMIAVVYLCEQLL